MNLDETVAQYSKTYVIAQPEGKGKEVLKQLAMQVRELADNLERLSDEYYCRDISSLPLRISVGHEVVHSVLMFDMRVDTRGFSARATRAISSLKIRTIRDLVKKNRSDFDVVNRMGNRALEEIENYLQGMSLRLGMTDAELPAERSVADLIGGQASFKTP